MQLAYRREGEVLLGSTGYFFLTQIYKWNHKYCTASPTKLPDFLLTQIKKREFICTQRKQIEVKYDLVVKYIDLCLAQNRVLV